MSELFVSDQRWVYAKGPSLSAALHRLADALPDVAIPADHRQVCADTAKTTVVEVLYDDDPDDDEGFYRAGICISWKPGI